MAVLRPAARRPGRVRGRRNEGSGQGPEGQAAKDAKDESILPAPPRAEGEGPFKRLILRGVTLIDGTGAPPIGPVDIVIERNRIARGRAASASRRCRSSPASARGRSGRPRDRPATACTCCPGFIDMHGHIGGEEQGTTAEYVFKLWMAHGITTVREPGCGNGVDWCSTRSATAARATRSSRRASFLCLLQPHGSGTAVHRRPSRRASSCDGSRRRAPTASSSSAPATGHHARLAARRSEEARPGHRLPSRADGRGAHQRPRRRALGSHQHGALVRPARGAVHDRTIQDYPADYNYNDEPIASARPAGCGSRPRRRAREVERGDRRADQARLHHRSDVHHLRGQPRPDARHAAPSGTTSTRCRRSGTSTSPAAQSHGAYWFTGRPTTRSSGRTTTASGWRSSTSTRTAAAASRTGSDSGFIFKLYGFDYIRELELLQEAGFHPLEVIRSATLRGAEALGHGQGDRHRRARQARRPRGRRARTRSRT